MYLLKGNKTDHLYKAKESFKSFFLSMPIKYLRYASCGSDSTTMNDSVKRIDIYLYLKIFYPKVSEKLETSGTTSNVLQRK